MNGNINPAIPLSKKIAVIKQRPNLSNGNLKTTPAPDSAYNPQTESVAAIERVITVGWVLPDSASFAMPSPAPKKRYHSGPPKIIATCSNAAMKHRDAAIFSCVFPFKRIPLGT